MTDSVSKDKAQQISKEINDAVKVIMAKHGLLLTKQTTGYGDSYKFSIQATEVRLNADGINLASEDVIAYERFGYGVPSGVVNQWDALTAKIGTRFMSNGKTFAFAGVKARGKMKIVAVNVDTKQMFTFPDSAIHKINEASAAK